MSEPFPTKADIDFFISEGAKRIQELWEPKCGHWVLCWHGDEQRWGDEPWLVLSWYCEDALDVLRPDGVGGPVLLNEALWLPRQGQLQAMLEERGLNWSCDYLREAKEEERYRAYCWSNRPIKGAKALVGPTPSIALGKCLLEVMK